MCSIRIKILLEGTRGEWPSFSEGVESARLPNWIIRLNTGGKRFDVNEKNHSEHILLALSTRVYIFQPPDLRTGIFSLDISSLTRLTLMMMVLRLSGKEKIHEITAQCVRNVLISWLFSFTWIRFNAVFSVFIHVVEWWSARSILTSHKTNVKY